MSRLRASGASASQGRLGESIVSCEIRGEHYAMRASDIREIVRAERMRRGRRADGAVGEMTIDGETTPVYSLGSTLHRDSPMGDAPHASENHIIITSTAGGPVGWLVDRIARSRPPSDAELTPLPPIVGVPATRWFEGLLQFDNQSQLVLSPEHLDPWAPALPSEREHPAGTAAPHTAVAQSRGGGSSLVVMFSSPALPRCGVLRCGLSARRIAAVIQPLPICIVPGSAPYVTGVAAWRGEVMPVMDFRDAADRSAIERERLLILHGSRALGSAFIAFPVDAEMTLHQPTPDDCETADELDPIPPFVAGTFVVAGKPLALIDIDALLA